MAGHATDGTAPGANAPGNPRCGRGVPIGSAAVVPADTESPAAAMFPRGASAVVPPPHPDLPPRWPAVVRAELVGRHAELLDAVADVPDDRILDLSLPAGRATLADRLRWPVLPGSEAPPPAGGSSASSASSEAVGGIDVVISVAGFTRFPDLGAALSAAVGMLAPAGQLLVVEPDYRPGVGGLAVSSLGALLPPVRGVHLARDVPGTVRSVGLTVTDVRRLSLSTPIWPLRRFVRLQATRITADNSTSEGGGGDSRRHERQTGSDTGGVK
jgi:hypothetical protein